MYHTIAHVVGHAKSSLLLCQLVNKLTTNLLIVNLLRIFQIGWFVGTMAVKGFHGFFLHVPWSWTDVNWTPLGSTENVEHWARVDKGLYHSIFVNCANELKLQRKWNLCWYSFSWDSQVKYRRKYTVSIEVRCLYHIYQFCFVKRL